MIEQPGKLHLGYIYDTTSGERTEEPYLLSMRDLLAGAVCLGAAGVGKAGLGMCVLEEALLQNIPALVVDPNGELANLFAKPIAEVSRRRAELAEWDMDESRILTLADRAVFQIYTPGGDTGLPVNVWQSLNPPPFSSSSLSSGLTWADHAEALRTHIAQVVSGLLALAGIESDPAQGREHILLAAIFESAWRAGLPLDVSLLMRMIQDPPLSRIGAFDMDVFYPKAERAALALVLNNIAMMPSFGAWQTGAPLDIAALLKPLRDGGSNPAGKTRANIFNLAQLNAAERQFFLTLFVSELLLWMHTHAGASFLRCVVYLDAVSGLHSPFPGDPLTTTSIGAVIQQGRAAGVGLLLSAQDPAGLDYAGLAGIGAWFIGNIRTTAQRASLLDGLKSAGVQMERDDMERLLGRLPARVFAALSASGALSTFQARPTLNET